MDRMGKKAVKGIVVLLAAGQVLLTAACGKEAGAMPEGGRVHREETEEREGEEMKITAEYLKEEFGISEEELEGIDLEDFLELYEFTMDNIQGENVSFWLERYRDRLNGKFTVDYSYLFKSKNTGNLTTDNEEQVTRFLWHHAFGETNEFILIDFDSGRIFSGEGTAINFLTEANVIGRADDALKEQLLECFQQYDIYSWWESDIQATDITGESWTIIIELTDGNVCKLRGESPTSEDVPKKLVPFIKDVEKLAGLEE